MIKQKIVLRSYIPEITPGVGVDPISGDYITADNCSIKLESLDDFIDRVSEEANQLNTINISYLNENVAVIVYNTKSKEELVAEMYTSTLNAMGIESLSSEEKEEFGSKLAKNVINTGLDEEKEINNSKIQCMIFYTSECGRMSRFINSHTVIDVKYTKDDKIIVLYKK